MNEQALIDELKLPQYAGLTDQQAADAVNAKTVQVTREEVPAVELQKVCSENGLWGVLKIAALDTTLGNPPRGAAVNFIDWILSGNAMSVSNPAVQVQAGILMAHGLATADQIAAIAALGTQTVRWVDAEGIGECGIGFVINARKAIARGA
jgi:hypothetical protein